jgi:hypothetical protein
MSKKILVALLSILAAPVASAEMFWSDTSWSLLNGSDYEVGDDEKTVFTVENASGHSWGSTFLFSDRLSNQNDDGVENYTEVLANINLTTWDDGFVKSLYVTPHAEFGPVDNLLYGVGVGLNVPGARYFEITYFVRKNGGGADDNSQVTLVWAFDFLDGNILYDGFLDATDSSDDVSSSTNFTSQLKWDLGKNALDMKPGKLWLGVEYVYWDNKFGIKDSPFFNTDERNVNLLKKLHM